MKNTIVIFIAFILLSCGKREKDLSENTVPAAYEDNSLSLPEVPDSITDIESRATFVVSHYWDAMDFGDGAMSLDTAFVEQNFSNFTALLGYAPEQARVAAVDTLVARCSASASAMELFDMVAYKYLDDPNSPMRNEELYVLWLESVLARGCLPADMVGSHERRLADARKNRPGSIGADFALITAGGRPSTLHKMLAADTTVVMFYDPDCEHCREVTARLAAAGPRFRVLAVAVEGSRELWESTRHNLPREWETAYATEALDDEGVYVLPALPALYLIAPDGTVLLKDFPL